MDQHQIGERLTAKTSDGMPWGAGRAIAYTDAPTFVIEREDGTRFSWRADMCEPVADGCDIEGCDQPAVVLLANDEPLQSSQYAERRACRWHRSNAFPNGAANE